VLRCREPRLGPIPDSCSAASSALNHLVSARPFRQLEGPMLVEVTQIH
jgi:hypothetical protein